MKVAVIVVPPAVSEVRVLEAHLPPPLQLVDLVVALEVLVLQPAEVAVVVATNFQ